MIWNPRGTPAQNALVQRFLDASDFPDEVMAPSLLAEGKTAIAVEFADLSQRGARATGGDHDHEQEHAEGVHSIVREVDGRARVLGLFYLPPFTRVVIDAAVAEQNPTLAVEVLAAEAAHAWDYHWLLPQGMRRAIWNIVHGIAGSGGGPIPESGDIDHGHSYFDGTGGYSAQVGETIMELLTRAFVPGVPVTIQLAHPFTPEMAAQARALVLAPLTPQPDPALAVYRGRSSLYHDHHRTITPVKWYPDAAAAEADGLRACRTCRPGGRSLFLDSGPDDDDEQGADDHDVPPELVELFEVLEWEAAVAGRAAGGPDEAPEARASGDFVVSRAEWGARAPRSVTALHNPPGVTFHYVGPRYGPFDHSSCASKVRAIQAFHMGTRGWSDGAYNMVACPHGYAFILRGRDVRSAANGTNAGNSGSHAICALLGDGDTITDGLLLALHRARDYLMGGGTGPRSWGHRDWKATGCPGNPLYAWLKAGMRRPGSPTPTPSPQPTPELDVPFKPQPDAFHISPAHSGLVWDLPGAGGRADQVITARSDGGPDQRWRRVAHPDGTVSLLTRDGTLALDCPKPWGKNSRVTVWDPHGGAEQRFRLEDVPGDPYTHLVRHAASGFYVAPAGGGHGDAPLVLWDVVDGLWFHHRFTHTV